MKKKEFLVKIINEGKLKLVKPSNEVCKAYLIKSKNSLKASKILLESKLYENSVSDAYYSMYYSLLALLFKCGIKSENHMASIFLLNDLFKKPELYNVISETKEERIEKQYYVEFELTKDDSETLIKQAEDFCIKIELFIDKIKENDINKIRIDLKDTYKL